jgi:hypothetical protein
MIFPGYASLIVDSFSMKLSDCMALGYFDIFILFFLNVKSSLKKLHM